MGPGLPLVVLVLMHVTDEGTFTVTVLEKSTTTRSASRLQPNVKTSTAAIRILNKRSAFLMMGGKKKMIHSRVSHGKNTGYVFSADARFAYQVSQNKIQRRNKAPRHFFKPVFLVERVIYAAYYIVPIRKLAV